MPTSRSAPARAALPPDLLDPARRLTVAQAAAKLAVHPITLHNWCTGRRPPRGVRLRSYLVGGRRFILPADLDHFLAELQEVANA
jgi:hypothetical protein